MARKSYPVTWLDVAVGLFSGFLLGESPFTPHATGPKLAIAIITAGLYVWRKSTRPPRPALDSANDAKTATKRFVESLPPLVWVALATWLALFAPTLDWMYARWTGSFWHNNHSMIIAVLIVLQTRATLRREANKPLDPSLWGLPLLAAGLILALADSGMRTQQLASIGFVLTLPGMSLLLLGRHRTAKLWVPLAMSVFLVPMPSLISNHTFLRMVTTDGVLELLHLFGISASLFYAQIEIPGTSFSVTEACSGFATLVAGFSLGLFVLSACPSPTRRIVVLLSILPLTVATNTLRVFLLVLLSMWFGVDILDTMAHEASGIATFIVVIGSMFVIAGRPAIREAFE